MACRAGLRAAGTLKGLFTRDIRRMVTVLLYADDAVLLAGNEEQVKRGLKVLEEWCKEWAVEVNVEKSGVMHMRRRGFKRTAETFC